MWNKRRLLLFGRQPPFDYTLGGVLNPALLFLAWRPNSLYQDDALTVPAGPGDPVGGWRDLSGNNRHATQALLAAKPTRGTLPGGCVAISLDGIDDKLAVAATSIQAYTSPTLNQTTVIQVLLQVGSKARNTSFSVGGLAGGERLIGHPTYDDVLYFDFVDVAAGEVSAAQPVGWDDTPHSLTCLRRTDQTQRIVVDTVTLVSAARATTFTDVNTAAFILGTYHTDAFWFEGVLAATIVYPTGLSDAHLALVEAGVRAETGI